MPHDVEFEILGNVDDVTATAKEDTAAKPAAGVCTQGIWRVFAKQCLTSEGECHARVQGERDLYPLYHLPAFDPC